MGFQSYPKWRQGTWAFESLYHPVFGHGPLPARVLALVKAELLVIKGNSQCGSSFERQQYDILSSWVH